MAEEEKDEVLDKKAAKAQEKAARAEAKAQKKADRKKAKELNDDLDMDDETSTGGKIVLCYPDHYFNLACHHRPADQVRCRRFRIIRSGAGVKGCSLCE